MDLVISCHHLIQGFLIKYIFDNLLKDTCTFFVNFSQAKLPVKDLMPSKFCDDPPDDPGITGAMAIVARGNCTFADKALRSQHFEAETVVIISEEGLVSHSWGAAGKGRVD